MINSRHPVNSAVRLKYFNMIRLLLFAAIVSAPTIGIGEDRSARDVVAELIQISKLQQSDDDREKAHPFSRVTVECLPYADQISFARHASRTMELQLRNAKRWSFGMDEAQLAIARLDLLHLNFPIDNRIAKDDVVSIARSISKNLFVDPRVLRMKHTDNDTVVVTTGVVHGPLSGGGADYIARRENGGWIVRHSISWFQ